MNNLADGQFRVFFFVSTGTETCPRGAALYSRPAALPIQVCQGNTTFGPLVKGTFKYYVSKLEGGGGLFQFDDYDYYVWGEGGLGVKMITNDYYI